MQNEKIITIAISSSGSIYGLSSSGHLAYFDQEAGAWVTRCSPEILTVDKANTLKKPSDTMVFYSDPKSRYDYHRENHTEVVKRKGIKLITPINVIFAIIAFVILAYFFIRH